MKRWVRVLLKTLGGLVALIGFVGLPDDLAVLGSWVQWLKDNTFDWRLLIAGFALFAAVQFWEPIYAWVRNRESSEELWFSVAAQGMSLNDKEHSVAFRDQPWIRPGSLLVSFINFRITNKSGRDLELFYDLLVPFSSGKPDQLWLHGNWKDETILVEAPSELDRVLPPRELRERFLNSPLRLPVGATITGEPLFIDGMAEALGHVFDWNRPAILRIRDHVTDSVWRIPTARGGAIDAPAVSLAEYQISGSE